MIPLSTLQSLSLCCLGLTTVKDDAFQGLNYLRVLRLNSNNLTDGPSLQHIGHLTHLYLYSNMITNLSLDYFAGCVHLKALSLRGNQLVSLPDMTHVAHSLQFAAFSVNRLVCLDALGSMLWPRLQSLSLSYNLITGLIMSLPENAKALEFLDLSKNDLRTLPDLTQLRMFQNTSHVLTIGLSRNLWHCNESLRWVLRGTMDQDYLNFDEGFQLNDPGHMRCHTPSKLKNMSLWDLGKFISWQN